jgi:hypothetical protein
MSDHRAVNNMPCVSVAAVSALVAACVVTLISTAALAACRTTLHGELVPSDNRNNPFPVVPQKLLFFSLSEITAEFLTPARTMALHKKLTVARR